jgi:hypothetical protein
MPAVSERQRRAAGAELSRRRSGRSPLAFKGMSIHELRKMASKVKGKRLPYRVKAKKRVKRRGRKG